ncbi:MAG: uridine phosphorylase [Candidatus Methanomarinus sp.]|nr:MAG: uridine phosphorylase [ANME-2 cluster archaeon]
MNNTYHLAIDQNLVSNTQWLITCGDPLRTDKIASYLDDPEMIGNNREYRIWTGTLLKTKIAVISHGIGGPGLSIMLDEAFKIMPTLKGVIRIGTCSGLSKEASAGKVAISEGAVRLDGASPQIIHDLEYPAVPDIRMTYELIKMAQKLEIPYVSGITVSTATFYTGQGRKDGFHGYQPDETRYYDAVRYWSRLGAVNMEMECSLLFIMGRLFNIPTACVTAIIGERPDSDDIIPEQMDIGVERAIRLVIEYLGSRIFVC